MLPAGLSSTVAAIPQIHDRPVHTIHQYMPEATAHDAFDSDCHCVGTLRRYSLAGHSQQNNYPLIRIDKSCEPIRHLLLEQPLGMPDEMDLGQLSLICADPTVLWVLRSGPLP